MTNDRLDLLKLDAKRYRHLREKDIDTIEKGGVFAGMTPDNYVLNGYDLDEAIDAEMQHNDMLRSAIKRPLSFD